jgi:hypothetical protein
MARGDLVLFEEFKKYLMGTLTSQKAMDFDTGGDTFKLALITNAVPPTAALATPVWADLSANEVSGTGYTAGGAALANQSANEADGTASFDADDVTWAQAGGGVGGLTGAYWAVLYDDTITDPADPLVLYVDMAGPVNNNDGPITVSWNANGIFKLAPP